MNRRDIRESIKMSLYSMGESEVARYNDPFLNKAIDICYRHIITGGRVLRLGGDSTLITPTSISSLTATQSISIQNTLGNSAITSKTFDSYIDLDDIDRYYDLINIRHNGELVPPLKFEHIADTSTLKAYFSKPAYYEAGNKLFFINGEGLTFSLYYYGEPKPITSDSQTLELKDEFIEAVVSCVLKKIYGAKSGTLYEIFNREFKYAFRDVKDYYRGKNQRGTGGIIPLDF